MSGVKWSDSVFCQLDQRVLSLAAEEADEAAAAEFFYWQQISNAD